MDVRTDAWRRLDLHNVSIDFAAPIPHRCGFAHPASGQVYLQPHRQQSLCHLEDHHLATEPAASSQLH